MTSDELSNLKNARNKGILKFREGDTWVEYQNIKQMDEIIEREERKLNRESKRTTRLIATSKGY